MQQIRLPNDQNRNWLKDILLLSFVLGGIFFIFLGTRPLFVPDEGRYAEIAREMVASGDYVTPWLNGIKYFEKPVLFYWLESAAIQLGGLNLWSIRSVNALLGLLGCLLTYYTMRKLYNRQTGLLAAFILGTSILYFVMTHMISLDLPVTFFITLTLYAFILGTQCAEGWARRLWLWTASIAAACAVLTKGLIGIVFPGMIILLWITLLSEWRLLLKLYLPSCIVIFLLVTLPWHILVGQRNPEFFYFYFIHQQFLRYTTLKIGHYQPAWFFIPALLAGFFPWSVFLVQAMGKSVKAIFRDRIANKLDLFFVIWAVLIFVFFSISKSKLIPYILPIFPPLAILTARYLESSQSTKGTKAGFICLLLASLVIAGVFFLFPLKARLPDAEMAARYLHLSAILLLAGTTAACFYLSQIKKAIIITTSTAALFLLVAFSSMPYVDTRTILPFAQILNPILKPTDEIVAYNQYFQDLPFYLERRITILNWRNELTYGMKHQDASSWMIKDADFWKRWHSNNRLFAIMGKEEYENFIIRHRDIKYFLLGETVNYVLISNQRS